MFGPRAGSPTSARATARTAIRSTGTLVDLADPAALDAGLVGGKAAALAGAAKAGLPTLPGVVLTTAFAAAVDGGASVEDHPALQDAFAAAGGETGRLIARSSSLLEDTSGSSMAGQFESVAGVAAPDQLAVAVRAVLSSRARAGAAGSPIAVLVQPEIEPAYGGVLFGVDPVSGRSDRRVVAAVRGSVEPLVSGAAVGARYVLDQRGRILERDRGDGPSLRRAELARLSRLADRAAEVFGGPQDIEWAVTPDGELWLLQSRPVTTEVRGVPAGPVYGPGPVAETFPEPLTELEQDLWLPPLREAVQAAVALAGTVTRKRVAASEAVIAVRGRVAVDLLLAGDGPPERRLFGPVNPLPAARRLRAAWRVGRLRAALPHLADHVLERVDADLRAVPTLATMSDRQLVGVLHRSREALRSLHAHEILMGLLTDTGSNPLTGAGVALRVLAEGRRDGLTDAAILERNPVVLALVPPRVAPRPDLSDITAEPLTPAPHADQGNDNGVLREALRLRVRWLQELGGRVAWELGTRLQRSGQLPRRDLVRHLTLDDLDAVLTRRSVLVPALVGAHVHAEGAPLPARFQLSDAGQVIRVASRAEVGSGTGAGGGVGRGPVTHDAHDPPVGSVLVTTTLTPGLGPLLHRLEGIVAETGSVLSHLAILAREAGVATVVGYDGAVDALPEGTVVVVDGETGRVGRDEEAAS
jgi:phosphohistidine swiveling domain-containing protein